MNYLPESWLGYVTVLHIAYCGCVVRQFQVVLGNNLKSGSKILSSTTNFKYLLFNVNNLSALYSFISCIILHEKCFFTVC